MNRVMIFIGLKIAEIGGTLAVFTGLSFAHRWVATTRLGDWGCIQQGKTRFLCREIGFWWDGLIGFWVLLSVAFALVLCALALAGLWCLIKKNWEWSGTI